MLPRLTWPTCIKHASLGACIYICIYITVKELCAPRSTKRFHFVGFTSTLPQKLFKYFRRGENQMSVQKMYNLELFTQNSSRIPFPSASLKKL